MNLSPYPHRDDRVYVEGHNVTILVTTVKTYVMSIFSATFQGNDRPSMTAYGDTAAASVASLYNALTVEYELEQETNPP